MTNNSQLSTFNFQLPTGWEVKKLGEVCEILDKLRKPITKKNRIAGNYPYYGATGILDYVHDFIFNEKLILIGEDGAKWNSGDRSSFIVTGKYWVNNHAHVVRPYREIILDNWIVYFLNFSDLSRYITGLTVPKLNQGKLKSIEIPIPPLPEQQRIVKILDKAFSAIDKAKQNAQQNLGNAKEVFESYLQTTFDNGKLKVENGEWKEMKLGEVSLIKPPKKEAKEKLKQTDYVTFLPMKDLGVLNKNIIGKQKKQLKEVLGSYTYFANNDVLLAKITPCFENRKIGIANNLENGIGFGSSEYLVFRSLGELLPAFIYYFLSREDFIKQGKKRMKGAVGHKRVAKDWIENFIIPIPPIQKQQKIVKKLDALQAEAKKLEAIYQQKINNIDELKKSILQKAFEGEL